MMKINGYNYKFWLFREKRTFLDLYDFKLPSVVLKLTALLLIVITSDLKILECYFKKENHLSLKQWLKRLGF